MFFIGIFGIETKQKLIGEVNNFTCKSCKNTQAKIIKSYHFFHFFFIPIFRWKEEYFVVCSQCQSLYSISKEKGKAFENGSSEISYWDLKSLKVNDAPYLCPSCGKEIEEKFEYCPYCGKTLH